MATTPGTTSPTKKMGWGRVIIVTIAISAIFLTWGYLKRHPETTTVARKATINYPTPDRQTTLTLTTEWSPVVYNRRDMNLEYFFRTPNLWWQMRINGKQVYDLTPINYPESTFFVMTQVVYTVEWRIAPASAAPENEHKALSGQLEYCFKPKPAVASAN